MISTIPATESGKLYPFITSKIHWGLRSKRHSVAFAAPPTACSRTSMAPRTTTAGAANTDMLTSVCRTEALPDRRRQS